MNLKRPPNRYFDREIWKPIVPFGMDRNLSTIVIIFTLLLSVPIILVWSDIIFVVSSIYFYFSSFGIMARIFLLLITLLYMFIITIIHEFFHALCCPKFDWKNTYLFFDKRALGFSISYYHEMSKKRRMLFNAMPLIIISCIFYLLSLLIFNSGYLGPILRITAVINLANSSADILGLFLILKTPPGAIFCQGMWRECDSVAEKNY